MKKFTQTTVLQRHFYFFSAVILLSVGCRKFNPPKPLTDLTQVNLVANTNAYSAAHIDPTLIDAWGLVFSPTGTPWVNSLGGHVSEVYDREGALVAARPAVNIPSPAGATGGLPTGIVFNGSATDFLLANGLPARFIFVGADGILSGWNAGNNAQVLRNNASSSSYTGLTTASLGGNTYLYAANFRAGKVEVWDSRFAVVPVQFKDNQIPAGYAPFNVQAVGMQLFVTYAKVGADGRDQAGAGNGYIDIFNPDGSLVKRLAAKGSLNSPWGIAQAPGSFINTGDDHGDDNGGKGNGNNTSASAGDSIILAGNFGDGRISAFRKNGDYIGQLKSNGWPVTIDGLWALSFPPATSTIDQNRLYFTAGPKQSQDGLFGYLIKK